MERNINYNIKVDDGNSIQTISQLEAEVEGLNSALKYVKPNSEQFKELSKQVQGATKKLNALNKEVEGITLEDKLDAADGAIKTLAGSTQALVGGFGLLGIESEKLSFLEGKAADAISFGMGLKDLSEGFGKLAKSTAVASAAQKVYNAVQIAFNAIMAMNPLGILIVSLTAAGALIFAFRDKIMDFIKNALGPFSGIIDRIVGGFRSLGEAIGIVETQEEKLAKQMKANREQAIKDLERQIELEKARGNDTKKMEKDLFNLKLQHEEDKDKKSDLVHQNELARINNETKAREDAFQRRIKEIELEEQLKKEAAELDIEFQKEFGISAAQAFMDAFNQTKDEAEFDPMSIPDFEDPEYMDAIDASLEFNNKLVQAEKDKNQMIEDSRRASLDNLIYIAGAETKVGKALLIAKQVMAARELLLEVSKTITFSTQAAARSTVAVAEGTAQTARIGFPQNIPMLIGYAAQAVGIIGAIKSATSKAGASIQTPRVPSSSPTRPRERTAGVQPIDVASQQIQNQGPIMAYTLSGNVRDASEADAKIKAKRSVG